MRVTFIGGGVMGEAMVRRLLAKEVAAAREITVSDVSKARREALSRGYGVNTLANNQKAVGNSGLVVLAVKPQDLDGVLRDLRSSLSQQLVLSIVAGASLASLCQGLNHSLVVRAMPNMPAQIGEGITVWTATAEVGEQYKEVASSILGALGKEMYVSDERYIDMATALSGSGPAYVFLIIEALVDAGVHIGLARSIAEKLVLETILGSAHAVAITGKTPAELRNMVTSPGGTTAEGLLQLEKGGLRSSLLQAVIAAYNKAKELKAK